MYKELINDLTEALKLSPNNIPIRLRLGKCYDAILDFKNAEDQFLHILKIDNDNIEAKFALAKVYFSQKKHNASLIILEEILPSNANNISFLELYTKTFIELNDLQEAQEIYKSILEIDPNYTNSDIDNKLRLTQVGIQDEIDEDGINSIEKPNINFSNIGGLLEIKKEISLKIIHPLKHPEIYKAYGKKTGGGILLYGPPGCGKTHIARATAGEIDANFISIGINDILDMWIGSSEKNLHEIFEVARKNKPCVIFIDEIDALGANRSDLNRSGSRTIINQFLSELDGIESKNDGILILGATNTPWYLDPAFRRPGRFDRIIFVSPPDEQARKEIFNIYLEEKPTEGVQLDKLSRLTKGFSGADIQAVIDIAVEEKIQQSFDTGILEPLTMNTLNKAIKKHKPSTTEWFNSAKNYALYSNESGLYDEVLSYLKIKK
ncbi:Anaphase-promoting complex, cyclosome, subunit 3 [Tenacibaculum sp. MAR_2009_124]|uniref:ATP-binding protein n=1 Tax=Tenacibaculum sp. MAR_2009_124 TaxID=1250059 RepID=UPI00089A0B73|nr:ATP-binding protein [Tenacibaculum sp. MAR_2009_124]SEB35290.1 Anaphase-promoting complex, cyclosome, subunit 3 [Tenacibaculum sp. MAR_2009_124]